MSLWNRLPADILSQVFELVKDQDDVRNPATNILPLLSVSKAWSKVAYKTAYHTICYYGSEGYSEFKPTAKLLKAVKNEIAGHNTRKIVLRTVSEKGLKKILLHFATYCPNVTSIDCTKYYEEFWRTLAVSSLYPKLTVLPHPCTEIGGLFNLCAWRYKKQLEKQYALAHHPSEPNNEVERLGYFPKIRHLVLLASNSGQVFYLDNIMDAYPQITCLEFQAGLILKRNEGYSRLRKNPTLYYPHENLDTLIVSFAYEHNFFEYLIHKFPNVKYGEISTTNYLKPDMKYQDQYLCDNLDKLLAFTGKNSVTIKLHVSYVRLNEILGNTNVKNLELRFLRTVFARNEITNFTISKGNLQISYPIPLFFGLSIEEFTRIWKPVSANITKLKIQYYSSIPTFDVFQEIFSYQNCLTDFLYKTCHCFGWSKEPQTINESRLKSLSLDVDDIQEDIYPSLSKIHPQLTRLTITLNDTKKQDVYRIDMSGLRLERFDFYININKTKMSKNVCLKVKTQSEEKTYLYVYTGAKISESIEKKYFEDVYEELKKVEKKICTITKDSQPVDDNQNMLVSIALTVELKFASLDNFAVTFTYDDSKNKIYILP